MHEAERQRSQARDLDEARLGHEVPRERGVGVERIGMVDQRLVEHRPHLQRAVLDNGREQRLLARKVLVDDRLGAAGGRSDLDRAGRMEAVLGEETARDLEDQRATLLGRKTLSDQRKLGGCDSHPCKLVSVR